MATLAVLNADGFYNRNLSMVAGFKNLDKASIRIGEILSWKEGFPAYSYRMKNQVPHLIEFGKATIYIGFTDNKKLGYDAEVRVESTDIGDLAKAVERVIAYMGGHVSTFDVNPSQPNSFVGGVANDLRRLRELCHEWVRLARQQLGFRVIG